MLKEADIVVVCGSELLQKKWNEKQGVVHVELQMIFHRYKNDNKSVIPISLGGSFDKVLPGYLIATVCIAMENYEQGLSQLIRRIYEIPFNTPDFENIFK